MSCFSWLITRQPMRLTDLRAAVERPSWFQGGGGWEGAKERVSNIGRPRLNCQREKLLPPHSLRWASTSRWGFKTPTLLFHFSLQRKRCSLSFTPILILPRASFSRWSTRLAETGWKLIQFGKVSQLGNNWNTEVPLLNWPHGNTFSNFDEVSFGLKVDLYWRWRNKGASVNIEHDTSSMKTEQFENFINQSIIN